MTRTHASIMTDELMVREWVNPTGSAIIPPMAQDTLRAAGSVLRTAVGWLGQDQMRRQLEEIASNDDHSGAIARLILDGFNT